MTARAALTGVAFVGAVLLLIAEFSAVYEVVVGSLDVVRRSVPGRENHAYALAALGVAAAAMAVGASSGARPPAVALAVLGAAALFVALAIDLPDTRASGRLPESIAFEDARARAGSGFVLELVGAVLLLLSGGLLAWMARESAARGRRGADRDA